MIQVPDDLFRDVCVQAMEISDSLLAVTTLLHEGRLLGASQPDYELAVALLNKAISKQVAQQVIWQACLDEVVERSPS